MTRYLEACAIRSAVRGYDDVKVADCQACLKFIPWFQAI